MQHTACRGRWHLQVKPVWRGGLLLGAVIPSSDIGPGGCSTRGGKVGGRVGQRISQPARNACYPVGEAGGQGWGSITWSELARLDHSTPRWGEGRCWAGCPSCTMLPWPPGGEGMGEKQGRSAGKHPLTTRAGWEVKELAGKWEAFLLPTDVKIVIKAIKIYTRYIKI